MSYSSRRLLLGASFFPALACSPAFLDPFTFDSDASTSAEPHTGASMSGTVGGEPGTDAATGVASDGETTAALPDMGDERSVVQVAIHSVSGCALLSDGAVRCWGYNLYGELGYGHTQPIGDDEHPSSAGDVPLGAAATQIAVAGSHACAVLVGGAVKCWGYGGEGQLGNGSTDHMGDDEIPADIPAIDVGEPVVSLTAGWSHTCALLAGGRVRCWGENLAGQLGYGHTENIGDDETPASAGDVSVGGAVVALSAGLQTTCAVLVDGSLRCWGSNHYGQVGLPGLTLIGDDELPSSLPAVDVGGPVVDVAAAAYRTCALLASGAVRCFGENWNESLGTADTPANCEVPDFGTDCGLDPACCVGDDETPASRPPVDIGGTVAALSGAGLGTCALLADGAVRCWGTNRRGMMGHGDTPPGECFPCTKDPKCCVGDDETPASRGDLSLGGPAAAISVGQSLGCALMQSGEVRCWGYNDGVLGLGFKEDVGDDELPSDVPPLDLL